MSFKPMIFKVFSNAVLVACIFFTNTSCKRSDQNSASETKELLVDLDLGSLAAADAHIILDGKGVDSTYGVVIGSRGEKKLPGNIVFVDVNGREVAKYPIYFSIADGIAIGSDFTHFDTKMDLDIWSGKTVEQILGTYWGGTLGVTLFFGGGGVDFSINSNGIYLRNASLSSRGLYARLGVVAMTIEKRSEGSAVNESMWKKVAVSSSQVEFEGSRKHWRRAWILTEGKRVAKIAIERQMTKDPKASGSYFVTEAMIVERNGDVVANPQPLTWQADQEVWDNRTRFSAATMRLNFTRDENDTCYLSYGNQLEHRLSGRCSGFKPFLQMWCGPNKPHCS